MKTWIILAIVAAVIISGASALLIVCRAVQKAWLRGFSGRWL